jgi:hypothetical protein
LTCTTAPNIYLITASTGTQTCQPRYFDNGDGTVTDNQTGLMWEQKSGTIGPPNATDVHGVNNSYTWSGGTPFADGAGTHYSDFLPKLNGLNGTGGAPCFAGCCDWRNPSVGELRSILFAPFPTCAADPCIDPTFGPTQWFAYWSSSSPVSNSGSAWYVSFFSGNVNLSGKARSFPSRAVRGGR